MHNTSTYRSIWSRRSSAELQQIAHIKRFMERWSGDSKFRTALTSAEDKGSVARRYGLTIDPVEIRPLYDSGFAHSEDETGATAPSPLITLWRDYHRELMDFRRSARVRGETATHSPKFHRWRQRQIRRVDSECGPNPGSIVHPIVAFELSEGCSVGCWFCGISAKSFQGYWPYSEANATLWKDVLSTLGDLLGPAVETGFLYWATDPLDNPDYPKFLEDFLAATGYLAQTTTAVPLRDLALTRKVLELFDTHQHVVNRFSVLTPKILDRVHETFTPEELLGVEIVPQMKGSIVSKSPAGKARARHLKTRETESAQRNDALEATTIACVSGFLVRMMRGTVELVSPTRPSSRWPDGYKIWGTRHFDSAETFRAAIEGFLDEEVSAAPAPGDPLAFRPDLRFRETEEGFELASPTRVHRVRGWQALGRSIASGTQTLQSVRRSLVSTHSDPLTVEVVLDDLYSAGLLREAVDIDSRQNLETAAPTAPLVGISGREDPAIAGAPGSAAAR